MKKVMMIVATAIIGFAATAQDSTNTQSETTVRDTAGNGGMNGMTEMPDKIGNMSTTAFMNINKKGGEMVAAIKPTATPLTAGDKKLLMQVAAGGQRQLAVSQAVLDKVTNPQVRVLAQSEVEEQTALAAKLKEMADAKGLTLPEGPADSVQMMVSKVTEMESADVDAFYINEGGVKGHELLQKTMTTVNATAKDAGLKKLATVTLPVIRTHLSVSRDLHKTMGLNSSAAK